MFEFSKRFLREDSVFYSLLLLLVAVTAFGLGRMSLNTPEITSQTAQISYVETTFEQIEKTYVASKKGTKYHLPWCPGAMTMKEENKIVFNTKAEAESAGYTPAANCPEI